MSTRQNDLQSIEQAHITFFFFCRSASAGNRALNLSYIKSNLQLWSMREKSSAMVLLDLGKDDGLEGVAETRYLLSVCSLQKQQSYPNSVGF